MDDLTVEDCIDALGDLTDDELDELRAAIDEEIAERAEPIRLEDEEEEDEEEEE
jgi:hypothetical protein